MRTVLSQLACYSLHDTSWMLSNKLKETTLRKHRCPPVAQGTVHKLTPSHYTGNEHEKKPMWQVILQLYMESGFSLTQRNSHLFDIALIAISDSEKLKSDGPSFRYKAFILNSLMK